MKRIISLVLISSLLFTTSISAIEIPVPEEKLEPKTTIDEPKKAETNQEELLEWDNKLYESDKYANIYFSMMMSAIQIYNATPGENPYDSYLPIEEAPSILRNLAMGLSLGGLILLIKSTSKSEYRQLAKSGRKKGFKRITRVPRNLKGEIFVHNKLISIGSYSVENFKKYIKEQHNVTITGNLSVVGSLIEIGYGLSSNLLLGLQFGYSHFKALPYFPDPEIRYSGRIYPLDINTTYLIPSFSDKLNLYLTAGLSHGWGELSKKPTETERIKYIGSNSNLGYIIASRLEYWYPMCAITFELGTRSLNIDQLKNENNELLKLNDGSNVNLDFNGTFFNLAISIFF